MCVRLQINEKKNKENKGLGSKIMSKHLRFLSSDPFCILKIRVGTDVRCGQGCLILNIISRAGSTSLLVKETTNVNK